MARNKYPEETVQKILEIAGRLFLEKGYDQTSIQDIVSELGMSKGAVYHHFQSKEEIFNRICSDFYDDNEWFERVKKDKSLNGLQKLQRVFFDSLGNKTKLKMDRALLLPMLENPRIVVAQLRESLFETGPIVARLIEEGNKDGSMEVSKPAEAAELLMLLTNIWANPALFSWSREEFMSRVSFIKELTDKIGLPVIDEEVAAVCGHYYEAVVQGKDIE